MSNSAFTPSTFGQGIVVPGVSPGQVSSLGLPGRTDGSAITGGYVGEVISSVLTTNANTAATGVYFDARSITLTAGIWQILSNFYVDKNTATFTSVDVQAGVSTSPGNTSAELLTTNWMRWSLVTPTTFQAFSISPPSFLVRCNGTSITRIEDGVTFSAGVILYLKAMVQTFSSGQPVYQAKLTARRIA